VNLGTSVVIAGRFHGFRSTGKTPDPFYFGGNMEMRGYDYLSFAGNTGFFANVELRLPIIDLMKTPIGILGPVRGTIFGNIGGAHFKGEPFQFSSSDPYVSYVDDPIFGQQESGFHLVDGRASYGVGLQFFFLGYPLHFDFSRLTDLKVTTNNTRFDFWIGYDF
jgi:outer membrane protein assembly factor BamA